MIQRIDSGREIIKDFLDECGDYLINYKFSLFKYPFDFYVPEHNIAIEYESPNHFSPKPIRIEGINNIFTPEQIAIIDSDKDEYCKLNNIKLIRVKYVDFNNTIKDLYSSFYIYSKYWE